MALIAVWQYGKGQQEQDRSQLLWLFGQKRLCRDCKFAKSVLSTVLLESLLLQHDFAGDLGISDEGSHAYGSWPSDYTFQACYFIQYGSFAQAHVHRLQSCAFRCSAGSQFKWTAAEEACWLPTNLRRQWKSLTERLCRLKTTNFLREELSWCQKWESLTRSGGQTYIVLYNVQLTITIALRHRFLYSHSHARSSTTDKWQCLTQKR